MWNVVSSFLTCAFFSPESRDKKKQAKCQLTVFQKIGITEERWCRRQLPVGLPVEVCVFFYSNIFLPCFHYCFPNFKKKKKRPFLTFLSCFSYFFYLKRPKRVAQTALANVISYCNFELLLVHLMLLVVALFFAAFTV